MAVVDPLRGLIDGLLQGHALGTHIKRQQMDEQAFKTNQALHDQQMSVQDIMNRQMLQENARPVENGAINLPALTGSLPNAIPGMPDTDMSTPGYHGPADPARTVSYGGGQYELRSPEEMLRKRIDQNALLASEGAMAQADAGAKVRERMLNAPGGGVVVPDDVATTMGLPIGHRVLRNELPPLIQEAQKIQKGYTEKLAPGETLFNISPRAAAPGQAPPVIASGGPEPLKGEFGQVFLPAFAESLGVSVDKLTPRQRLQAVTDYSRRNPNTLAELAAEATDMRRPQEDRDRANAALKRMTEQTVAGRPVVNIHGGVATPTGEAAKMTGQEYLNTLSTGMAAEIKAMAEGRTVAPAATSRSPEAQQKRTALFQYDPGFTEQRAQLRRAFTTGKAADNIGALNTAMVHLGRLGDTAEALKNGGFTPGNEMYNYFKDKFGSATVTNFELLKDAVSGEMAAALKGNATDIEIANMKKSIRASNSPDQMRGVVVEGMNILNDKAQTYDQRYHREMPDDPWSPILPAAKAAMQRNGAGHAASGGGGGPAGKIAIISPEGTSGFIDADKWPAAQQRGFRKQ